MPAKNPSGSSSGGASSRLFFSTPNPQRPVQSRSSYRSHRSRGTQRRVNPRSQHEAPVQSPSRTDTEVQESSPRSLPTGARPENNEPELDYLDEVIMAVDLNGGGTVGCCYYVAKDEKLYFMEDVQLGGLDAIDSRMRPVSYRLMFR